jgi:hypothetical protein
MDDESLLVFTNEDSDGSRVEPVESVESINVEGVIIVTIWRLSARFVSSYAQSRRRQCASEFLSDPL